MARNEQHDMLPQPVHDENARQMFVLSLKKRLGRKIRPQNRTIFDKRAEPAFIAEHGRRPETPKEAGTAMLADEGYRFFCALNRTAQESMWQSILDTATREEPRMRTEAKHIVGKAGGTLELDPDFDPPRAMQEIDVHLQPGGYTLDRDDEDLMAGALYESGGSLYSRGQSVGLSESKAELVIRTLAERYPDFTPTRILDIGCSAGASSTPYAHAFPNAEVHAVDIGGSMLRYAHARAEALGVPVHFHQRDAADLGFEDGSFDLIVSHNAMHEMSRKTTAAMMRETRRLLAPGGIAVHQDVPLSFEGKSAFEIFESSWDQQFNNEPFWESYASLNPADLLAEAGFADDALWTGYVQQKGSGFPWRLTIARN